MITTFIALVIVYYWIMHDEKKERQKACKAVEAWARQQDAEKDELRRQQEENEKRIEELEDELFRLKYKR